MAVVTNSTLSSWMSSLHQTLLNENIDADNVFLQAGVSLNLVHKKDLRVAVDNARQVWADAVIATSDDAIGLKVASNLLENSLDPLNLVIESSSNVGEAIERLIKFYGVISNGVLLYQHKHHTADIVLAPKGDVLLPAMEAVDAALGLILKRTQSISAHTIQPIRVEFMRQPPKNRVAFNDFFNCELHFGCELNRICYPLNLEHVSLVRSNESLSQVLDTFLDNSVKELAIPPFSQAVSALVCELLLDEAVSLISVAAKMNIGTRTLQRNLKREGTSFKQLLDTCKVSTAKKLLAKKQLSVTDIGFLLGFSSASNFVRFFKRFAGVSPGEYQNSPDQ